MKILLISANTVTTPYPVYPIGLDHVAASLAPRHRVLIADLNLPGGLPARIDAINRFAPDLVGISLRNIDNTDTTHPTGYMDGYRSLVDTVRRLSGAPVVLGGSGFTLFPRQIMQALSADYGIVGEGERLNLLVEALEAGKDPRGLPGLVFNEDGAVDYPPPWQGECRPPPLRPTDRLGWYLANGAMLNLQTKRGCPFRCIYCTYPLIEGPRLRLVDPMAAARTALALQHAGARYLYITDSSFNADWEHSLAVARAFRTVGLRIPWGAFFTPLTPPHGYYAALVEAGLTHVEFGTDALTDNVLTSYRKPFRVDQAIAAHEAALAAGCHVAHYLLVGGPGETRQTLETTLARAGQLRRTVLFLFCGMRIYPRTALFQRSVDDGLMAKNSDLLAPVFYRSRALTAKEIDRRVAAHVDGRRNWVIGAGGDATAAIIRRMHAKGLSGPLWEHLIR